ncbi:MraY family glycosyltransferase [Tepidimonas alkaliphilus]|uniref:MraY family glycosyltransferase n=1 Tax=Tepidimonas alkaliphilus TaxID=2588942 RepID=UPI001FE8A5EA|nr:glycosyltransferase [Tepidimonas alkaliphilus]
MGEEAWWLLLAALPAFLAGLSEDLTKKVGVIPRLVATMASAAAAAYSIEAVLPRLGIPLIDELLWSWIWLAWLVTMIGVAGVANAINIIDGFNGLASAVAMLMLAALGYVAWVLQDEFLVQVCLAAIGALAGFFVWNYPRGLIFLGDGGAYLAGFFVAEVAVMLVVRHSSVSPWFCFLVCAYPITETLFSIYRKTFLRGVSPGVPDALHLHMLIYRRMVRWAAGGPAARDVTARNAATSPYLWGLSSVSIVPAVVFWHHEVILIFCVLLFVCLYIWAYISVVKFRVPEWMLRRLKNKKAYFEG